MDMPDFVLCASTSPVPLSLVQYCECTDGSHIEVKASALVWHYGDADPDFGNWQVSRTQHSTACVSKWIHARMHACCRSCTT